MQATAKEATGMVVEAKDVEWPEDRGHDAKLEPVGKVNAGSTGTELGEGRPAVPFGLRTGQQALTIAVFICIISCFFSYMLAKWNLL